MPIRPATRDDIPIMAKVLAASFGPDAMFQVMFPYQQQFPESFVQAMRDNLWLSWYDYRKILMVSYDTSNEVQLDVPSESDALLPKIVKATAPKQRITGLAEWERVGKGWERLYGLWGWWDPRRIIKPLLSTFYSFRRRIFGNRASVRATSENPDPLMMWDFVRQVMPYILHFFDAPHRQTHWSLEILAVHPHEQGKGYGKDLVLDGLERSRADPEGDLPVCVIAGDRKETFYQKYGFKELVGWVSRTTRNDGSDNPLRRNGVGGGAVLWTR